MFCTLNGVSLKGGGVRKLNKISLPRTIIKSQGGWRHSRLSYGPCYRSVNFTLCLNGQWRWQQAFSPKHFVLVHLTQYWLKVYFSSLGGLRGSVEKFSFYPITNQVGKHTILFWLHTGQIIIMLLLLLLLFYLKASCGWWLFRNTFNSDTVLIREHI